jgi:hypothetical protein
LKIVEATYWEREIRGAPKAESGEGKTPAIGDHQTRELLAAPGEQTWLMCDHDQRTPVFRSRLRRPDLMPTFSIA